MAVSDEISVHLAATRDERNEKLKSIEIFVRRMNEMVADPVLHRMGPVAHRLAYHAIEYDELLSREALLVRLQREAASDAC